ncbi:MAG: hypothetical protein ACXWE7_11660, partial [Nitrososphaeraceae archaeon]
KKKQVVLKKTKSSNINSKSISNKPKPKKTSKVNSTKSKKDIILKRSSGREEKFDTNKLTQTVSRSGVSFPVARDVAKSITKKIKKSAQNKSTGTTKKKQQQSSVVATKQQKLKIDTNKKEAEKVIVTASQITNLVDDELKDRNQQDHSPSFSGNTTIGEKSSMKITLDDREPVMDKVAANKNKVLFDPSKQ